MKRFTYILTVFAALVGVFTAKAATPEQMEQARVVAFKACLRDLNNGSDYLEKINPKSMADLEGKLKNKEKENIQKLKNIQIPDEKEYASWGKDEFEKYWSVTFAGKANLKTRQFTAGKIKSGIKGINVTKSEAPASAPEAAAPAEAAPAQDLATQAEQEPAEEGVVAEEEVIAGPEETTVPMPTEEVQPKPEPAPQKKKQDNTTPIVLLCVLVVVVVILVCYALNVMKKNRARQASSLHRPVPGRRRRVEIEEEEDDEEEYEEPSRYAPRRHSRPSPAPTVMADPEEESPFAAYSSYQPEPEPEPELDARDREIARLKAEIASLQGQVRGSSPYRPATDYPRQAKPRVIYLAQANSEGVFTRADARYNMGNSIFKLVTTDGVSGSFSVIEDPTVFEIALMMPKDFLVNACAGRDLLHSEGAGKIINEASGTAIFEDGRWRVSRKAQIRYAR